MSVELSEQRRAFEETIRLIDEALGGLPAFRRIDDRLFMIRQGSAYVMVMVQPLGARRVLVRLAAQVVTGITMTGELARRLLRVNARLRFGSFGYQEKGQVITLSHAILGGDALCSEGLLTALEDLALLADEFDDKLIAVGGGARMVDVIQEEAVTRARQSAEFNCEGVAAWDE